MAVRVKRELLTQHSMLHLKLMHAAIGSYPVASHRNSLTVNRLLMIFFDNQASSIQDLSTGKLFNMRSGFIYFIPAEHEILQTLSEDLLFVSFQFNLDFLHGFDLFKNYGKCVEIEAPELIAEARELLETESQLRTLCRVNEIIYNLCVRLLDDQPVDLRKKALPWERYEKILDFVRKSIDATITVGMLADIMGMRQDVFSRKFTRDMGVSPKDYITNILVREASSMLLKFDLNIRTVAQELKFNSEYYFSRFFKKHTGLSPKQFRKLNENILN